VTNPTRLAIALKYDATTMKAPRVVAKGARLVAQRIRETARAAGVPIVEHKPLAQALYKAVPVGAEIPGKLYRAVAEILAYVWALNRRFR
jgi:flagellar biosynthetic protein FlhB